MRAELSGLQRWSPRLRIIGIVALVGAVILGVFAPSALFRGYLAAFIFWLAFPLGSGGLLLLHALAGGRWGRHIRPLLAPMLATLPLFVILFLPVAGGVTQLYTWSTTHEVAHTGARALYLNLPFFFGRSGAYFVLWVVGALLIGRGLRRTPGDEGARELGGALAAIGMILYVLTVSFAAVDWIGSLDAHWYSSIIGLYLLIGQALSAMTAVVLLSQAVRSGDERLIPAPEILHDLGTLLLTFVSVHAYFAYSQFFIIWNGNLPHEISWYIPRMRGAWGIVSAALMLLHFFLPFALLLSRTNKRNPRRMIGIALWILFMRLVEAVWMVVPSADHGQLLAVLGAVLSFAAMGAGALLVFNRVWRRGAENADVSAVFSESTS